MHLCTHTHTHTNPHTDKNLLPKFPYMYINECKCRCFSFAAHGSVCFLRWKECIPARLSSALRRALWEQLFCMEQLQVNFPNFLKRKMRSAEIRCKSAMSTLYYICFMMAYTENPVEQGAKSQPDLYVKIFLSDLHGNESGSFDQFRLQFCFVVLSLGISQYVLYTSVFKLTKWYSPEFTHKWIC